MFSENVYGNNQLPTYPIEQEDRVFYETVSTREECIAGAIKVLHSKRSTLSTKALARIYLGETYNPRHLPVPLKYFDVSKAILDPQEWLNSVEARLRR